MKKRLIIFTLIIVVLAASLFSLTACSTLKDNDAFDILREAYENSTGLKQGSRWGEIYYYQEQIKEKAYLDNGECVNGYQNTLSVNIHCKSDDECNYYLDQDYTAQVEEKFYTETIDKTEKTTINFIGSNNIYAVNNKNKVPSLFITKNNQTLGEEKYTQADVTPQSLTKSEWFKQYTLQSKLSILSDLTLNDIDFVDTKDAKNGRETMFMTTKLSFKIKKSYFESHPEAKILNGNYVYIEIVNVSLLSKNADYRISNLYVYKTENVGNSELLKLDYESYALNISYLGPNINPIDSKDFTTKADLFDTKLINQNYLFKP